MKRWIKISLIAGMAVITFSSCGNSEREAAVKNIERLQQEYEDIKEEVADEQQNEYVLLGESVQALVDITDENSGDLETKEQIESANQLAEELRAELSEMAISVEESGKEQESGEQTAEVTLTFRNDSTVNAASISVLEPQSGAEQELDSFETGKRIETKVKLPVDNLEITWYLYNNSGECIQEKTTNLEDIKSGVVIYYTDDGVYTEFY